MPGWAARCRAEGRREYRFDLPQRRLVSVGHEVPVDVERERSAVVVKPFLDALNVRPAAQHHAAEPLHVKHLFDTFRP